MSGHGFLFANYVPGNSLLHRAPLWLKFLLVLGCGMASFLIVAWAVAAAALVLMCALFLLSGAGFRRLFRAVQQGVPGHIVGQQEPVAAHGCPGCRARCGFSLCGFCCAGCPGRAASGATPEGGSPAAHSAR